MQLPAFSHGLIMSHGNDDILQYVPIKFWLGQADGRISAAGGCVGETDVEVWREEAEVVWNVEKIVDWIKNWLEVSTKNRITQLA